jgi:hypothetical protein
MLSELKAQIHQACLDRVEERIQNIENRLQTITESKESEVKSSVGDKFETGRAMLQIEEEKMLNQLHFNRLIQGQIEQISLDKKSDQIRSGSLVKTEKGLYFIGIGLGKVKVDQTLCYCVSLQSPVGMALIGRERGDEVATDQLKMTVLEFY